jgi:hypothetical protein
MDKYPEWRDEPEPECRHCRAASDQVEAERREREERTVPNRWAAAQAVGLIPAEVYGT